jgi:hypothetical protein
MPGSFDLDDDEKAALVELLRETIERDRFPLSPRMRSLPGDPRQAGAAEIGAAIITFPVPKPSERRSLSMTKKRVRRR